MHVCLKSSGEYIHPESYDREARLECDVNPLYRWEIHYLEPNIVTFRYESTDKFLNVKDSSGQTVHMWDNEKSGDSHWTLIPID